MITDTHAHIFWKSFAEDRTEVLERAKAAGVSRIVLVGTDLPTSLQCFELAAEDPAIFPTAGIHPHDAKPEEQSLNAIHPEIRKLCERDDCVAVGETGLDFFKEYSPQENQEANFRWHLDLAVELNKPVIVHCRDAHERTLALIREYPGVRGVMHCYTMGPDELPGYLDSGFYISFSGVVTYPKNDANREAAKLVPEDRLLVETDCPFLSPQSKRGRRNEPALVAETLAKVAELRGADFEALAHQTSRNASELFGLAPHL